MGISTITQDMHRLYLESQIRICGLESEAAYRRKDTQAEYLADLKKAEYEEQLKLLTNGKSATSLLISCLNAIISGEKIDGGFKQQFSFAMVKEIMRSLRIDEQEIMLACVHQKANIPHYSEEDLEQMSKSIDRFKARERIANGMKKRERPTLEEVQANIKAKQMETNKTLVMLSKSKIYERVDRCLQDMSEIAEFVGQTPYKFIFTYTDWRAFNEVMLDAYYTKLAEGAKVTFHNGAEFYVTFDVNGTESFVMLANGNLYVMDTLIPVTNDNVTD